MALLAVLLGLFTLASEAYGAGELDPTFGGDGRVVTDVGPSNDFVVEVAIQGDGKIVAAGGSGAHPAQEFALARYNPDGSLDATFGGDGRVVTDFAASTDVALGVAIQADGKIVAAGFTSAGGSGNNFALARYNPNGSLDATFGGDGRVVTDFSPSDDAASGVAIQADGKIVAAGGSAAGPNPRNFALARYNPDGSLDATFSGDGKQLTDFGANDGALGVAIQANGKIVAAGFSSAGAPAVDFVLARYNPNGSLDATFDGDGRVVTDVGANDSAFEVAIQADGKIVAAGVSSAGANPDNFALTRYNSDGSLDASFDGDGRVVSDFGAYDLGAGVDIQADGKIVAAGYSTAGANPDNFALARYNPDGSLDATFDGDGRVVTDFGGDDAANDLAIQPDGKIVAAGVSGDPRTFALARYLPGTVRPPTVDHFLWYPIENGTPAFQSRTVTIQDQFMTSRAQVVEPLRLLNPVSKDGGPIRRPGAHLECYRIVESSFGGRTVTIQNQFGTRTFQVEQPTRLCNPASKRVPPGSPPPIPSGLDHFRCYGIEGSAVNRTVTLQDQFGRQVVVVEEPEYLCNAASKNGSPILNPAGDLVCYELDGVDPFTARRASLRDQFGVQTFTVARPTKLCVSSRKLLR